MRRVVVTGAAGNIGKPLVRTLRAQGVDVFEVDHRPGWRDGYLTADIRNPSDMLDLLGYEPDVIFHLASMVSRVTCESAPSMAVDVNLVGTQNIIEIAVRTGARLVYFSTSEVYGNTRDYMRETMEPRPNNRYGLTKLLGERLVEYEAQSHGLDAITLRPFMMYDAEEEGGDHRSAMIRFAENLADGVGIEVHENSARGWLYVDDAVRAIIRAGEIDEAYTVVNIGNPDVRPTLEVARLVCDTLGADRDLIRVVPQPGRMTLMKNPMLRRQEEILRVTPEVTLEDGVKRVCDAVMKRRRARLQ